MDASIELACPHCAAINRLPRARLGQSPRCGGCHAQLFTASPLALTSAPATGSTSAASFDRHALRSGLPLLVDFWAPWCGPCVAMAPQFHAAAAALEPQVRLAKVDTEAEPALGNRFAIRSLPTLVLLQSGRELARQSGGMTSTQIVDWCRRYLPTA